MCGIVGMLGSGRNYIKSTEILKKMIDVQHHRGPDDDGILGITAHMKQFRTYPTDRVVGLSDACSSLMGFVRLSIRDLSIQGHQPMVDSSNNVAISFNGEIYNADEIREGLKRKDHQFKSDTDTEVILESYLEYGFEKTIRKLNGMFAIVIADLRKEIFYLARDRVGIKPLYYTFKDGFLIYSSEIKGILRSPGIDKRISMDALFEKMMYRGATIPSLFDNVKWVEPGTYCTYTFDGGFKEYIFFNINDYKRRRYQSYDPDKKTLEKVLKESIERQMVSDVKVGCQLSGGVDSSLVCWYAKHIDPDNMNDTISIISPIKEFSEEPWIDKVNEKLGIHGHKFLLDVDRVMKTLPTSIWHLETILTQPNSMGILQISEHARDYVTVLLSGEGADEMMGGYECWFDPMSFLWRFSKDRGDINKFEDFVLNMEIDTEQDWVKRILPIFDSDKIKEHRKSILDGMDGDPYTRVMKYHFRTYLPELLLRQDKMSMANSIENRVPILDNEMVDVLFQMPIEDFIHERVKFPGPRDLLKNRRKAFWKTDCKYIFKDICGDIYGHDFAYRKKMGFPMPIISFMCSDLFNEMFYDVWLPNIKKRDIFDGNEIEKLFKLQKKLRFKESEALWRTLTFEMWCESFVD